MSEETRQRIIQRVTNKSVSRCRFCVAHEFIFDWKTIGVAFASVSCSNSICFIFFFFLYSSIYGQWEFRKWISKKWLQFLNSEYSRRPFSFLFTVNLRKSFAKTELPHRQEPRANSTGCKTVETLWFGKYRKSEQVMVSHFAVISHLVWRFRWADSSVWIEQFRRPPHRTNRKTSIFPKCYLLEWYSRPSPSTHTIRT